MRFDWARIRSPEYVVGASSVVLLASMLLLPWYHLPSPTGTHRVDGWNGLSHARWLLLVTVIVGLAAFLLQAAKRAPAVPVTMFMFAGFLGAGSAIWLIVRVLIDPPGGSRMVGGFIGLLAACGIAYGGYASIRAEGIAPGDAPRDIPKVDPSASPPSSRAES
jgi:hypothetical protein